MESWKKHINQFMNNDNFMLDFQDFFDQFPRVNLYKTENECIIVANIPGVKDIEEIDLYVNYRTIEISGKVQLKYNGFQLTQSELQTGQFHRTIELPYPVRESKVKASYHRGLLVVNLYRYYDNEHKQKRVKIKEIED
jgi:HSP20 family protein